MEDQERRLKKMQKRLKWVLGLRCVLEVAALLVPPCDVHQACSSWAQQAPAHTCIPGVSKV